MLEVIGFYCSFPFICADGMIRTNAVHCQMINGTIIMTASNERGYCCAEIIITGGAPQLAEELQYGPVCLKSPSFVCMLLFFQ